MTPASSVYPRFRVLHTGFVRMQPWWTYPITRVARTLYHDQESGWAIDVVSRLSPKSDHRRKFWTLSLYPTDDDHLVRTPLRDPQIRQRIPSRHPPHLRRLLIAVLPR